MTQPPSTFEWPPQPYVPGQTPRPDGRVFASLKSGLSPAMDAAALAGHVAFQTGCAAFVRGYYWEAHELLEAVWACAPPNSAERHLLQALIHLANAGLKARMGRPAAVARIRARAADSLAAAFLHRGDAVMGVTAASVAGWQAQIDREME